jgi:hypothetical protein
LKHLRETFTDQEFEQLKQAKGKLNWHNFIMILRHETEIEKLQMEIYSASVNHNLERVKELIPKLTELLKREVKT